MLRCEECPLWERHEYPGVPRQLIGRCNGPAEIKYSPHAPIGVRCSWPNTFQDDYCEHHPEFDKKDPAKYDEPFWTSVAQDFGPPLKYRRENRVPDPPKRPKQANLFD